MKISVPKTIEDCELWQLYEFAILKHADATTERAAKYMADVLAIFVDVAYDELLELPVNALKKPYAHIIKMMSELDWTGDMKDSVQIDGQKYTLRRYDERQWTFGQIVDISLTDFKKDAHKMLLHLYVKEGENYGDSDLSKTSEIFREKFPRKDFAPAVTFFLRKRLSTLLDTGVQREMKKATKKNRKAIKLLQRLTGGRS